MSIEQCKHGITYALNSIVFVALHPVLMIYLLIPAVSIFVLELFFGAFTMLATCITFVDMIAGGWLSMALLYHAHYIQKNAPFTYLMPLQQATFKMLPLCLWGLLIKISTFIVEVVTSPELYQFMPALKNTAWFNNLLLFLHAMGMLGVTLFGSCALVFLAYEKHSFMGYVRRIKELIQAQGSVIVGGYMVFGLLYAVLSFLIKSAATLAGTYIVLFLGLVIIAMILLTSAMLIFSARIYEKQQAETLQEFAIDVRSTWMP